MQADDAPRDYGSLTDADLLHLLATEDDRLPREAVDEFVRRGDRMIEPLTAICRDADRWRTDGKAFWAAVHATFILGAIGGGRAVPGLLGALLHAKREHVEWVTEELPAMFGTIGAPAVEGLMGIVADEGQTSMACWLAASCLGGVAARHEAERDRVLDFLRDVAGRGDDHEVRGGAGLVLLDFVRPADRDVVRALGKEIEDGAGPMPLFFVDDVDRAYEHGQIDRQRYFDDWLSFYDAAEIAARQARWKREDEARAARRRQGSGCDDGGLPANPASPAETRQPGGPGQGAPLPSVPRGAAMTVPKVGRNDPCPCGSGRKHKRCCGA